MGAKEQHWQARSDLRDYLGTAAKGEDALIDALVAAVRAEERAVITRKEREQIERLADCRAECERLEAALERSPQADGTGQP